MTKQELLITARTLLDDHAEPQIWLDEELTFYLNEAVNEAAIRGRLIQDSDTASCCQIAVTDAATEYALHPSVFYVDRAYDSTNAKPLRKIRTQDLDNRIPTWRSKTGELTHYACDNNHFGDENDGKRKILFYPKLVALDTATVKLTVYRTPLTDLAADADEPEIPERYHGDLLLWVCYRAYQKPDVDGLDINKALDFERRFAQAFGQKPNAKTVQEKHSFRKLHTSVDSDVQASEVSQ